MLRIALVLAATLLAAKLLGALAKRLRQPPVLGELIAGVLLGGSMLGLFDPQNAVLHVVAEIGVVVLLFEIGLHTDLKALARVGSAAATVAVVGVALPFASGYLVARGFGLDVITSTTLGAALTATSVGISARVLTDLDVLHTPDGQVVLGAAVLDDIIGLVILAVVTSLVSEGGPDIVGSLKIVGAFAAGLMVHQTRQRDVVSRGVHALAWVVVPIFFAAVGAAVEMRALLSREALAIGGTLVVVGAAGKFVAGFAPWWHRGHKTMIGVAMIPRGEVGLIFAQMGLAAGVLDAGLFGALMLMVCVTTFMTPPILSVVARRNS